MKWEKVSNDTIKEGILYTHSVLFNHTIYSFAGGEVQTIDLLNRTNVKMTSIKDDDLTPKRCFSGNILGYKTHKIYAIGGSDCNDYNKYYNTSQISQDLSYNGNNKNINNWWDILSAEEWAYIGIGFCVAMVIVMIYACCRKHRDKNNQEKQHLIGGHLQSGKRMHHRALHRRSLDKLSKTMSERIEVDM